MLVGETAGVCSCVRPPSSLHAQGGGERGCWEEGKKNEEEKWGKIQK
jgi:hypothetical protein